MNRCDDNVKRGEAVIREIKRTIEADVTFNASQQPDTNPFRIDTYAIPAVTAHAEARPIKAASKAQPFVVVTASPTDPVTPIATPNRNKRPVQR